MTKQVELKFPEEIIGESARASLFSYSSAFRVASRKQLLPVSFVFESSQCYIIPPIRIGLNTHRPIPMLNEFNVDAIFGFIIDGIPLQINAMSSFTEDGKLGLNRFASRGTNYDRTLPPDTLCLIAVGEDSEIILDILNKKFVPLLIDWLRVLSKQWWIGQSSEDISGHLHFQFQITPEGEFGNEYIPLVSQTLASADYKFINEEIWMDAISKASKSECPEYQDIVELDIYQRYAIKDYRSAILLFCCYLEMYRDKTLEEKSIRVRDLKTSSTDILKQLSIGFQAVLDRNLENEEPQLFEIIKSCWISRGHFTHGKPFYWKFNDIELIEDMPGGFLSDALTNIRTWFESL